MPLTPNERTVMDLWDAGRGSRAIARSTGMAEGRVRVILQNYYGDDQRAANTAVAAGSAALLAAIRAARAAPLPSGRP